MKTLTRQEEVNAMTHKEILEISDAAWIPTWNLLLLEKKFKSLNRRAKKLECGAVAYEVLKTEDRRVPTARAWAIMQEGGSVDMNEPWNYMMCEYSLVLVTGIAPVLEGWKLVARLEHVEHGVNLLFTVPSEYVMKRYRQADRNCEHCDKIRHRKDTFIVEEVATGYQKQVGSKCIADFLGHVSPEHCLSLCNFLYKLSKWSEFNEEPADLYDMFHKGKAMISLRTYLTLCVACMKKFGWVSRGVARDMGKSATADDALSVLWFKMDHRAPKKGEEWKQEVLENLTPEDETMMDEAIAWAQEIDENTNSDYLYNLRACGYLEKITNRSTGIAASMITAMLKAKEREKEYRQERASKSNEWIGTLGERREFAVTVKTIRYLEGDWGATTLYRMEDEEGNVVVWFSTSRLTLHEDESYKLKATIKKHGEYRGRKQTVINRATMVK